MSTDWQTLRSELPDDVQNRLNEKRSRRRLGAELASLRKELSLTQQAVADGASMTQNTVSKIESSDDILLSSIMRYMNSLGGGVEIVLKTADGKSRRIDFSPKISAR